MVMPPFVVNEKGLPAESPPQTPFTRIPPDSTGHSMSLKERILADMKSAMREKDTVRLKQVRLLRAAVQRREVDERIELDDEGVTQVFAKAGQAVQGCG